MWIRTWQPLFNHLSLLWKSSERSGSTKQTRKKIIWHKKINIHPNQGSLLGRSLSTRGTVIGSSKRETGAECSAVLQFLQQQNLHQELNSLVDVSFSPFSWDLVFSCYTWMARSGSRSSKGPNAQFQASRCVYMFQNSAEETDELSWQQGNPIDPRKNSCSLLPVAIFSHRLSLYDLFAPIDAASFTVTCMRSRTMMKSTLRKCLRGISFSGNGDDSPTPWL